MLHRRNELRRNLEAKYGDLTLRLGITDKYKKVSYSIYSRKVVSPAEHAMRDISSSLLSKAETTFSERYKETHLTNKSPIAISKKKPFVRLQGGDSKYDIRKKDKIRNCLVRAYPRMAQWRL